jgi:hypothetical protein
MYSMMMGLKNNSGGNNNLDMLKNYMNGSANNGQVNPEVLQNMLMQGGMMNNPSGGLEF